jgi:hypothetical protein
VRPGAVARKNAPESEPFVLAELDW